MERGAELLDADASVLMLSDGEGMLQVRAAWGVDDSLVARFCAPLSDEITERLQGLLGVMEDRFMAVPLVVGGDVTGLLAVATRRALAPADEWMLSALADQAAVAVENARLAGEVRLAMEERLRVIEGATSAKDRALSTLAHDIRAPLGAIEGYCGILEAGIHGPVNDRQRETLGHIRTSGRHLLSLLDNVMDMARIDAGVVRLNREPVRLVDVTRDAMQMLIPAAEAKLQKLTMSEASDVVVDTDHGRLRQVLVNLIGNAVKFTPQDGDITVAVSSCMSDGVAWGEICVRDTGPGIPASEQAAIFEAYYRSAETAHAPGVGLGLAISRALLEQMGGLLHLESEPGTGSAFTVRLRAGG